MLNEAHTSRGHLRIRDIIAKMRHDGCGGRAGRVELLTGRYLRNEFMRPWAAKRTSYRHARDGVRTKRLARKVRRCPGGRSSETFSRTPNDL
jgi:hypothetical protein